MTSISFSPHSNFRISATLHFSVLTRIQSHLLWYPQSVQLSISLFQLPFRNNPQSSSLHFPLNLRRALTIKTEVSCTSYTSSNVSFAHETAFSFPIAHLHSSLLPLSLFKFQENLLSFTQNMILSPKAKSLYLYLSASLSLQLATAVPHHVRKVRNIILRSNFDEELFHYQIFSVQ